jgi:hypothetical protein
LSRAAGALVPKPISATERRQLQICSGDDKLATLSDQFDSAVFLGSAPAAGAADPAASQRWDDYLKKQNTSACCRRC